MKKRISILLSIVMIFAMMTTMVGCDSVSDVISDNKESTTVLVYDDGETYMEYSMLAKGDKVQTICQSTTLDLSEYSEEDYETMSTLVDEFDAEYSKYDCVSYNCGIINDVLTEEIVFDATDMDGLQELSDAGLFPIETEDASYVSLKATIKNLEGMGFELQD